MLIDKPQLKLAVSQVHRGEGSEHSTRELDVCVPCIRREQGLTFSGHPKFVKWAIVTRFGTKVSIACQCNLETLVRLNSR